MRKYQAREKKNSSPTPKSPTLKVNVKDSEIKYESDIPNGTNNKPDHYDHLPAIGKRKKSHIITIKDIADPSSEHFGNHGLGNLINK